VVVHKVAESPGLPFRSRRRNGQRAVGVQVRYVTVIKVSTMARHILIISYDRNIQEALPWCRIIGGFGVNQLWERSLRKVNNPFLYPLDMPGY
jgi:hypothetical protein